MGGCNQHGSKRSVYRKCSGVLIWLGGESTAPREPYEWSSDFSQSLNEDDERKVRRYVADFGRYYQRPRAARFMLSQDSSEGVFCMMSLLAIGHHFQGDDAIPFFHAHLSRRKIMQALKTIMEKSWWGRQWVIQETVLAPQASLHYGRFKCPFEMFTMAARQYVKHRKGCCSAHYAQLPPEEVDGLAVFARTVQDIDEWRLVWRNPNARISLLPLLWQFRSRSTSNAKDKVYALLPLVNETRQADDLLPHYDWSDIDVYRDVVVNMVDVYKRLLILNGNTEKSFALRELPTWVPDWTVAPRPKELERLQRVMIYEADGLVDPDQRFLGDILELNGIRHDVISDFAELMPSHDDEENSGRVFKKWWDFLQLEHQKGTRYPAGGSLMEAYWSTLCMDTKYAGSKDDEENDGDSTLPLDNQDYKRVDRTYGREFDSVWMDDHISTPTLLKTTENGESKTDELQMLKNKKRGLTTIDVSAFEPQPKRAKTAPVKFPLSRTNSMKENYAVCIDESVVTATTDRRLFRTSKGYIGLGPRNVQKNDEVWVIHGGNTPFLLRPAGTKSVDEVGVRECHSLIGDCYLHGIMYGESVKDRVVVEKIYLA